MDLITRINRVAFVGPEFLTWLWYQTESVSETFQLEGVEEPVDVWFDDRLVVGSTTVNAQENHFKGGHPPTSLEARSALRLGKLATEARLRLVQGSREWSLVLKAADMSFSGIKIPAVLSKDEDERFYERMYLLEELDLIMTALFGQFLKLRVGEDWESLLGKIREWISAVAAPMAEDDADDDPALGRPRPDPTASPRNEELPPWEDPVETKI